MDEKINQDRIEKKVNTYDASLKKLKELVEKVEQSDGNFTSLIESVNQAKKLVEQCKKQLRDIEEQVNLDD